jgi:hypothetical protein
MSAWDELAEVIKPAAAFDYWPQEAARLVLNAGYRKPRVMTTLAELATLPLESVIIDAARCVSELAGVEADRARTWWSITGCDEEISGTNLNFPVTVLWEPADD